MAKFNHISGTYHEVNDTKIYVECIGDKENPALLLLHGGFEDIENMNFFAEILAKDYFIIGIDSRGHGKSTLGNKTLTYQQLQEDVEAILNQLNIKTVHIIGFSDGAIVGYRLAMSKNINVKKLISLGGSWQNDDIIKVEKMVKSMTIEILNEYFPENIKRYLQLNQTANIKNLLDSVIGMWLDMKETGYPNERVKNIESDTLLIRGDHDFFISLSSIDKLQKHIKNSSLLNVPFSEHTVYEEQPLLIETVLKQFLEK